MNDYVVVVEGLKDLKDLESLDPSILRAARLAVNKATDRGRALGARKIREQVAFPARYLSGENGRLRVSRKATDKRLEGAITGQDRPTSLARFSRDRDPAATRRKGGVTVTVAPGHTKFMKGAFLMRLRNGNLGLAVRLKPGESIRNKSAVRKVGKGLYLLYGPGVDQVFRTVAQEDVAPYSADYLEQEFLRLLKL